MRFLLLFGISTWKRETDRVTQQQQGGGSFRGEYARIIKQMNVIDQGSFFFFTLWAQKKVLNAECTSHNALRIKQTMKKPKIDKP